MLHAYNESGGMKTFMKSKTEKFAIDSMLAAMCAVLGYISLDFGNIKVTFESLPILLGAFLLGPVDGLAIGGIGTLIYQLLRYGITVTTPLWMLPYMLCGLLVGYYAKKKDFKPTNRQIMIVVVLNELMITILNTGVIYVDSHIFGYYTPAYVLGSLAIRFVICILRAVVFGVLLPKLIDILKKGKYV